MSRPKRKLQKRFVVFCEGDTEYNYIDKMRKYQGVQIVLKPKTHVLSRVYPTSVASVSDAGCFRL